MNPTFTTTTYDPDGNGLLFGDWDEAGRLKTIYMRDDPVAQYEYDHQGRRTAKWEYDPYSPTPDIPCKLTRFIYDDWNLVAALDCDPDTGELLDATFYLWGLDVSHTFQGAGGVGGLLAVFQPSATCLPCYDAAGNVQQYLTTSGVVAHIFKYDAFGRDMTYPVSNIPPFRFSTKYYDDESAFYSFGHRYYLPDYYCFISRDPLEESGGLNLYAYCENDPVNKWDYLGLWIIERKGKASALACAQKGDTFDSLGVEVQLDTEDYTTWAHTSDKKPIVGKKYEIPNTIYFHHGVYGWWINRPFFLDILRSHNRHESKIKRKEGYKVIWVEKNVSPSAIVSALGDEYLYQYIFAGHGYFNGRLQAYDPNRADIIHPNRYTKHGINRLLLFACGSADKTEDAGKKGYYQLNKWEWNVATRGLFIGFEGETNAKNYNQNFRGVQGSNQFGPQP